MAAPTSRAGSMHRHDPRICGSCHNSFIPMPTIGPLSTEHVCSPQCGLAGIKQREGWGAWKGTLGDPRAEERVATPRLRKQERKQLNDEERIRKSGPIRHVKEVLKLLPNGKSKRVLLTCGHVTRLKLKKEKKRCRACRDNKPVPTTVKRAAAPVLVGAHDLMAMPAKARKAALLAMSKGERRDAKRRIREARRAAKQRATDVHL